jgi:hypothetical protein
VLRIADLVDDDPSKRDRVSAALKDTAQKNNRDHVDIIIALGMAKEGFDWIWCQHARFGRRQERWPASRVNFNPDNPDRAREHVGPEVMQEKES